MASVTAEPPANPPWLDKRTRSLMDRAVSREKALSAVLMTYIVSGLVFMLLPGTFLGVWNLISISRLQAAEKISPGWIQAHGHAQIFGWVATFILGIGFYSIPKLRKMKPFPLWRAWVCWAVWTAGVLLRWAMTIWPWHWRAGLPLSATLEFAAFLLFFVTIGPAHSSPDGGRKPWEPWIYSVLLGTTGLLLALILQIYESVLLSLRGQSPSFPHEFDQRYLFVLAWGFLVPFVWGFSARWLPVFAGLRPTRSRIFLNGIAADLLGVAAALTGAILAATVLLAIGAVLADDGTPFSGAVPQTAKGRGHPSEFRSLHSPSLCVAARCRRLGRVGRAERTGQHGHLGRVSPRLDGWIHRHHGFQRGPARSSVLLRDEDPRESPLDAGVSLAPSIGLHPTRHQRSVGLSVLCRMGLANPPRLGID